LKITAPVRYTKNISQGFVVNNKVVITKTPYHDTGEGTNWDWLSGYVKHSNGTAVNNALVSTSTGSEYTNSLGYYQFYYQFIDGQTYYVNASKLDYSYQNQSLLFNEDHEVLNFTINPSVGGGDNPPSIMTWSNNYTHNANTSFLIPMNTSAEFNVSSNQTLITWYWTYATLINGSNSSSSYAEKNFSTVGTHQVSVYGTNLNGTTQTINWSVNVFGMSNLTLSGYVTNILNAPIQNARVDFNSNFVLTNATGWYNFSNISEQSYTMLTRQIGYRDNSSLLYIDDNSTFNVILLEQKSAGNVVQEPGFESIFAVIGILVIYYLRRKD
jgi:hypothetical protein